MNTLMDRGGYAPTFAVVDGVAQMVHLEAVILSAFNAIVDKGDLGALSNLRLLVPAFFKKHSFSEEDILFNFSTDKVLLDFEPADGNYIFGPINEKTAKLALESINGGEPVYREITLEQTGVFSDTFVEEAKEVINLIKGRLSLTDKPYIIYQQDKNQHFAEMYTGVSSLIMFIRDNSAKKLGHTRLYVNESPKPMTLDTALKTLDKMVEVKETVFCNLIFADNIKNATVDRTVSLLHENPLELSKFFLDQKKYITSKLPKGNKAYMGGVYSEYLKLGSLLNKKDINTVKDFANTLPKLINQVEKKACAVILPVGVTQ